MRKTIWTLAIIILLASCDRPLILGEFTGAISVTAKIVNPRDSIGINDTVKVRFEFPDSLLYNGNFVHVYYGKDGAICSLRLFKIDRAGAGSIGHAAGSIIQAGIGRLTPVEAIEFQNNGDRLLAEYWFIPKSKGVYFLEQQTFGSMSANDGQYTLEFGWNYGSINRNHQLLIDSAGTGTNFNGYIQDHINTGREIYGFKAN